MSAMGMMTLAWLWAFIALAWFALEFPLFVVGIWVGGSFVWGCVALTVGTEAEWRIDDSLEETHDE